MKQGVRILALNDSPFTLSDKKTLVIGIIGREGVIEGVISFYVSVDGTDSTKQILRSVRKSRFADQIKVIALNGTVIAGMNVIDLPMIKKYLKVEPIAITRTKPHHKLLEDVARRRLGKERVHAIRTLNDGLAVEKIGGYYTQRISKSEKPRPGMVGLCVHLLRLAHLVASGVTRGESKGRL